MVPTAQRSRIERSLSLHIDSKDIRTHSEYKAQLSSMFLCTEVPLEITFDAFKEQMEHFGFVDHKDLITTFHRFPSPSSALRMRFRDFAFSLLPSSSSGSPAGKWGEGRVALKAPGRGKTTERSSSSVWEGSELGSIASTMSLSSSQKSAPPPTAGKATALKKMKKRLQRRSASANGFGRRGTHVTNPDILDMMPAKRGSSATNRSLPGYETTSRKTRVWPSSHQHNSKSQSTVCRLPAGLLDAGALDQAPPRVNTWVTASRCHHPHEWMPPPLQPWEPAKKTSISKASKNQERHKTKYMLDTEQAAQSVQTQEPIHKDQYLPSRTQKLRNMMNQRYNRKPRNAERSHSPLAMMSMGVTMDGLRQRMHTIVG